MGEANHLAKAWVYCQRRLILRVVHVDKTQKVSKIVLMSLASFQGCLYLYSKKKKKCLNVLISIECLTCRSWHILYAIFLSPPWEEALVGCFTEQEMGLKGLSDHPRVGKCPVGPLGRCHQSFLDNTCLRAGSRSMSDSKSPGGAFWPPASSSGVGGRTLQELSVPSRKQSEWLWFQNIGAGNNQTNQQCSDGGKCKL